PSGRPVMGLFRAPRGLGARTQERGAGPAGCHDRTGAQQKIATSDHAFHGCTSSAGLARRVARFHSFGREDRGGKHDGFTAVAPPRIGARRAPTRARRRLERRLLPSSTWRRRCGSWRGPPPPSPPPPPPPLSTLA